MNNDKFSNLPPIEHHGFREVDKAHYRAEVLIGWLRWWPGDKRLSIEGRIGFADIASDGSFNPEVSTYDDVIERLYHLIEDCSRPPTRIEIIHSPKSNRDECEKYHIYVGMGCWTFLTTPAPELDPEPVVRFLQWCSERLKDPTAKVVSMLNPEMAFANSLAMRAAWEEEVKRENELDHEKKL